MQKNKRRLFTVKRIALNAVLVAMYIVLSTLAVPLGGLKLTFEHLPVILCAVIFGPVDGMLVGLLGEFVNQMLTFGLTPTTVLWMLPAALRGLTIGLSCMLLKKHLSISALLKKKVSVLFYTVCILSGLLASCVNTLAFYIDSKMFGYYSYAAVFGVFWIRLAASAVSSVLMALVVRPILFALKKAQVFPEEKTRFANADQAIAYIHSVCWKGSTPGLQRTRQLLKLMGNPEKHLKFVHIAGTNGKGSTAAMTASILRKAGYRTGMFTSPYIFRFHERMQVNAELISDADLIAVTEFVKPLASSMKESPTEFELVTCIAMEYFRRQKCDIVVLEVGMGGAMDSTNVIDVPEVAVITNIGLDHTEYLGDTVEKIAETKAGIFKEGGCAVVYRGSPSVEAVYEKICRERKVSLRKADFAGLRLKSHNLEGQQFDCGQRKDLFLPLLGDHQLHNAAVVLAIADTLIEKGWNISEDNIRQGLHDVRWPGRFDVMRKDPLFIIDGGHNPQCIEALTKNIEDYLTDRRVIVLTGVLADKDYGEMFRPVMALVDRFVCITPPSPRKLEAEELAQHLQAAGAQAEPCGSVAEGVRRAIELAGREGVVLCFGSLYTIGSIRDALDSL